MLAINNVWAADTLSGIVTDSISGTPLSSVKVRTSTPLCSTFTDASGKFNLRATGIRYLAPVMERITVKPDKFFSLKGVLLDEKRLPMGLCIGVSIVNGQRYVYKIMNTSVGQTKNNYTIVSVSTDQKEYLSKEAVARTVTFEKSGYLTSSFSITGSKGGMAVKLDQITCPGNRIIGNLNQAPTIQFIGIQDGANTISGAVNNIDPRKTKVVLYALTNQWYIQPNTATPYTNICGDGTWTNSTYPWSKIIALLVDSTYKPAATKLTHPSLDSGVIGWAEYPLIRPDMPIVFSGYQWGVKEATSPFDPGPNYFSGSVANIWTDTNGLHLKTVLVGTAWTCAEVYLLKSLGYGVYTYKIGCRVDSLNSKTVFSGFLYYDFRTQEWDIEWSDSLYATQNMQYVSQPWNTPGNIIRFKMPASKYSTHQIEFRANKVVFKSWKGWSDAPVADSIINNWAYTGPNLPSTVGGERFHFNNYLYKGMPPDNGKGDEIIIKSFLFTP